MSFLEFFFQNKTFVSKIYVCLKDTKNFVPEDELKKSDFFAKFCCHLRIMARFGGEGEWLFKEDIKIDK